MTVMNEILSFEAVGMKWNVLDKLENGYFCIADSIEDRKFGKNNNWKESTIRKELEELVEKIEKELGIVLPEFERNLLSLDGQTEYGTCVDKVSLLTVDEYRKYRSKLPNTGDWWWLITPDSTESNDDSVWIAVVSPRGYFNGYCCNYRGGVRPVCIFPSSIFESEE